MAENQYVNKFVYGGEVKFDISADTVTPDKLAQGITAHDKSGAPITGTNTYDADTSDADATAAEILLNKTAYVNGVKHTGTMPNNGAVAGSIATKTQEYTVPQGYHDGSGKVGIDATEQAKLLPENIKKDIEILGVTGTYEGAGTPTSQTKTVTPSTVQQVIQPDVGTDYLSQVTVEPIPYTETDNAAGGKTITIAAAAS